MKQPFRLPLLAAALVLLAACGDESIARVSPSIRIVPSHVREDGSPLLDYLKIPVLHKKQLALLVVNDGRAPLRVESLEFAGAEDGVFTLATDVELPFELMGGEQQELVVTFQPHAELDYLGSLIVAHNDPDQPAVDVGLKGTGSTRSAIEIEPDAIDFGRVGERVQEVRSLLVRSVGSASLVIETVDLVDAAPEFKILGSTGSGDPLPPPMNGQPGASAELRVACAPTEDTEETELTGTIRIRSTDPERPELDVALTCEVNRAPVAEIAEPPPGVVAPGDPIALDGSASHDPDGDTPLAYRWRIWEKPAGSQASLDADDVPAPTLLTDVAGLYVLGLDVWDAAGVECLHPNGNPEIPCDTLEIVVKAADDLYFELVWDHPLTDLDLHVFETGTELFSSQDCYFANPTPDFGALGDPKDDPRLTRDDLKGFGPERIVLSKPSDGSFDVAVLFAKANGASQPATKAILRVFVFGILEAELDTTLESTDQRWQVLRVEWPGAAITPIDTIETVEPVESEELP